MSFLSEKLHMLVAKETILLYYLFICLMILVLPVYSSVTSLKVCFVGFFLDYQPLTSNEGYMYPNWAYHLGWVMALSSVVVAPIWAVSKICLSKDPLRKVTALIQF